MFGRLDNLFYIALKLKQMKITIEDIQKIIRELIELKYDIDSSRENRATIRIDTTNVVYFRVFQNGVFTKEFVIVNEKELNNCLYECRYYR